MIPPIGSEIWTITRSSSATEHAALELLDYMTSPKVDAGLSNYEGDIPTVKAAVPIWLLRVRPKLSRPVADLSGRQAAAWRQGSAFETAGETFLETQGHVIVDRRWVHPVAASRSTW